MFVMIVSMLGPMALVADFTCSISCKPTPATTTSMITTVSTLRASAGKEGERVGGRIGWGRAVRQRTRVAAREAGCQSGERSEARARGGACEGGGGDSHQGLADLDVILELLVGVDGVPNLPQQLGLGGHRPLPLELIHRDDDVGMRDAFSCSEASNP